MKYFLSILFGAIISLVAASLIALPLSLMGEIYDDIRKNVRLFMFLCLWLFMI